MMPFDRGIPVAGIGLQPDHFYCLAGGRGAEIRNHRVGQLLWALIPERAAAPNINGTFWRLRVWHGGPALELPDHFHFFGIATAALGASSDGVASEREDTTARVEPANA